MMNESQNDMTLPPDLTKSDGTGPSPNKRPVYQDYMPPCNNGCPAGENIQGWLSLVQEGKHHEAWQVLVESNAMPSVHGRVCYHPCETSCNRGEVDSSVSIQKVERFLGDKAIAEGWFPEFNPRKTGKRVLVVGAGPSGLSAAYHLARMGHCVEIRDAGPIAGGMMHFGIPAYRLPRDILAAEIARIEKMGVKITLNHKVEDLRKEKEVGNFDATFVAVGAHISKKIDIPEKQAGRIRDAVDFLRESSSGADGEKPMIGRKVAVYGGGNTAMDAARTAKRLGAEETLIIYRRDIDNMPAHKFEAEEALEEGVKINWLRTIKEIDVDSIKVEKMQLDENGRPQPTGEYEMLEADSLILAVGQNIDSDLLKDFPEVRFDDDGTVEVDQQMMTSASGVFAGGDMVPSDRTVTIATGHGKKAARNIHAFLSGGIHRPAEKPPVVPVEVLNLWYNTDAERIEHEAKPAVERAKSFDEVVGGFSEKEAVFEASRCYSCGNCFECDGCYGACPEGAIIKHGKGRFYSVDYSLCTGCSACSLQCPTAAIHMIDDKVIGGSK